VQKQLDFITVIPDSVRRIDLKRTIGQGSQPAGRLIIHMRASCQLVSDQFSSVRSAGDFGFSLCGAAMVLSFVESRISVFRPAIREAEFASGIFRIEPAGTNAMTKYPNRRQ
jgi:hypothetical protein